LFASISQKNGLSKLTFLVLLFHVKSSNKWSNKSLNDLLEILQLALPNGANLPSTFAEAQKIIAKLGLSYEKIHVCPKNYQLYRGEKKDHDFCSKCGASRWKNKEDNTTLTKKERRKATPNKVLRYFPIRPRLKRLFMNK
jgi:DNA-directed RNA polymerase beta' subunit